MTTLTVQTIFLESFDLACDTASIHPILSLLEDSKRVKAYKIMGGGGDGSMTKNELNYHYRGYLYPSGKAVEKFDWSK